MTISGPDPLISSAAVVDEASLGALSVEDRALVRDEMALHDRVRHAVRAEALAKAPDMGVLQAQLKELRDEAITASERDLPALFQQLYTHHSLASRSFDKKLPDMRAPYFARLRLQEGKKTRDVLIGQSTFIDAAADITLIDWRHAALAKVFFNFREGDDYEIELPARLAMGKVLVRRVLTFEVGELVGITGPDFAIVRERGGVWQRLVHAGAPQLVGGAGKAVNVNQFAGLLASRRLPDISAMLDPRQYEILSREDEGALLILGGAGSGKTTIALHRMALLSYRRARFYSQDMMRVIVPEQGLVRFTKRLLGSLSLEKVGVLTFDEWATDQGRHILKGIPKRIAQNTPSVVITIKRHPAMIAAIARYLAVRTEALVESMRKTLDGLGDVVTSFVADKAPLMERLDRHEQRCLELLARQATFGHQAPKSKEWRRTVIQNFFRDERARLNDLDLVRSDLYSHPEVMKTLTEASAGAITPRHLDELMRHTRQQFRDGEFSQMDIVDTEAGREIDGNESSHDDDDAGTIDVEDYAVLLNWLLAVHGRVARKSKSLTLYRHMVIDEAQDVAGIELRLLGRALYDDGTMTVAGDAAQQSDPSVLFEGWDAALRHLDLGAIDEARLTTNYRCPRPIAEFAHGVLGSLAPEKVPDSMRDGMDVVLSRYANEGVAIVALSEALTALMGRERLASVAIVAANEESAKRWYENLRSVEDVRLVIDGDFAFKPGIDVTDVAQVKGLEFDYVIIPDADEAHYPDTPVARRTLHIAATRAVHQLWVLAVGRPSVILPKLG